MRRALIVAATSVVGAAVGLGGVLVLSSDEPATVATTTRGNASGTTAVSTTSVTTSEAPTTSSIPEPTTTTTPSTTTTTLADLPAVVFMGRLTDVSHGEDFAAYRTGDHGAIVVGPMTATIEGHGTVAVPAGTLIDRLCQELNIVLPGEEPPPPEPCYVRVDLDADSQLVDMFILQHEVADDVDFEMTYTVERVVGATEDRVIVQDDVRQRQVAWPLATGTSFQCSQAEWEPPDFPQPPDVTTYLLIVDLHIDVVTDLQCRGSF